MKKVFIILLTFLLVIPFFSCTSNNVEEDEGWSFLKATKKGVVINIPEEAIGKVTHCSIYRYIKDENGEMVEQMGIFCSRIKDFNQKTITDYFVNKGSEYYYKGSFWGPGTNEIKVHLTSVVSKGGVGEISIPSNIKGIYDEEKNIMTFSPKLSFSKNVSNFVNKNKDMQEDMYIMYCSPYLAEIGEYNRLVPHIHNNEASFLHNGDVILNKLYGHEIVFSLFGAEVENYKTATRYNVSLSDIDVPHQILIKDARKKMTIEENEKGFKITLPPIPEKYKNERLHGHLTVLENGERNKKSINISFNENNDNLSFIDYFVRPSFTYEYNFNLYCGEALILSTFPETVTYNGKYDFVKDFITPKASYNEKKSELTYEKFPSFSGDMKVKLSEDATVECYITYQVEKPDEIMHFSNYQVEVRCDKNKDVVQVKDYYHNEYIYDKPLNVVAYKTNVNDGYIQFFNLLDASLLTNNNMPEITVRK